MPIATCCPKCGKDYQLADEQAGRRVRCRVCQGEIDVPARPEQLEAVSDGVAPMPAPMPQRQIRFNEEKPIMPSMARTGPSNRTLLYVMIALGSCLVLAALICGGFLWLLTQQVQKTVDQVAERLDRPAAPAPPQPPPPPVEKPPEAAKVPTEAKITLPDLEKLLGVVSFKDLDDAVAKLNPKYPQLTRIAALNYIAGKGLPADTMKKKAIVEAVTALRDDKDEKVREEAKNLIFIWDNLGG